MAFDPGRTAGVRGCTQRLYPGQSAPWCILPSGHAEAHQYQPTSAVDERAAAAIAAKGPDLARAQAKQMTMGAVAPGAAPAPPAAICGAGLHDAQPRCRLPEGHAGGHLFTTANEADVASAIAAGARHLRGERMTIGEAVEHLKAGHRVARAGWNGKGMWLALIRAGNAMHAGYPMQDCIGMKTAQNVMQPGWLASQADLLAEDWEIVP